MKTSDLQSVGRGRHDRLLCGRRAIGGCHPAGLRGRRAQDGASRRVADRKAATPCRKGTQQHQVRSGPCRIRSPHCTLHGLLTATKQEPAPAVPGPRQRNQGEFLRAQASCPVKDRGETWLDSATAVGIGVRAYPPYRPSAARVLSKIGKSDFSARHCHSCIPALFAPPPCERQPEQAGTRIRAVTVRAAFQLFRPPSCGILDRTLGPRPKKLGRWAAAAGERAHRQQGGAPASPGSGGELALASIT